MVFPVNLKHDSEDILQSKTYPAQHLNQDETLIILPSKPYDLWLLNAKHDYCCFILVEIVSCSDVTVHCPQTHILQNIDIKLMYHVSVILRRTNGEKKPSMT